MLWVFSVPKERAAVTAGDDLRGLGICHQQAFSRNSGNGISAKYAILRKIALLASSFENLYLGLVNPIFTKDGDNVKVKVAVKFLDNQTKTTQVSQYELTLHKDGNWKSIM